MINEVVYVWVPLFVLMVIVRLIRFKSYRKFLRTDGQRS